MKDNKELEKKVIKGNGNWGEVVSYKDIFDDEKLKNMERYLNWKLNDDLKWWEDMGLVGRVNIEVENIIKDNDFYVIKYDSTDGTPIYELQSDCDRYRFCCAIYFNPEVTEFCFNENF